MYRLLTSAIALLFAARVEAESICASYFAAQGFTKDECTQALKVFDGVKEPCMSILWKTFDKKGADNCTARFLTNNKDKPHKLQIHFDNGSGRRLGRLGSYEIKPKLSQHAFNRLVERRNKRLIAQIKHRAGEIVSYIQDHANENTQVLLTTGLEDGYTNKAYRIIAETIKKIIPVSFLLGRNPNGTIENRFDTSFADFIELHSINPKFSKASGRRCVASTDGYSIEFDRKRYGRQNEGILHISEMFGFLERFRSRGCLVFAWWPDPQGRGSARFVDPRRRNFRFRTQDINKLNKFIRRNDQ